MNKFKCAIFAIAMIFFIPQQIQAGSEKCVDFGSEVFFQKTNSNETIIQCAENASKESLSKIFSETTGNNVPMNAVVAGVDSKVLSRILSFIPEEVLAETMKHRNSEDLSIVHLAVKSPNAAPLIFELHNWDVNFNVLKGLKESKLFGINKGTLFGNSDKGISALHMAVTEHATLDTFQALLANGVDPSIKDHNGNTALHLEVGEKNSRYDVLQLLLRNTDDLQKNDKGFNALHIAATNISDTDNIRMVFDRINSDYHDDKGEAESTVLHYVAQYTKKPGILAIVMDYSQKFLCSVDARGAKAIDYARKNKHLFGTEQFLILQNSCN